MRCQLGPPAPEEAWSCGSGAVLLFRGAIRYGFSNGRSHSFLSESDRNGLLPTISESPSLLASEGQGPLLRGGQNKNIGNTAPHLEDYPYYNVKAILLGALV